MEDAGVGEETTAQAAAFFDVALQSPRTAAAAEAEAAAVGGNGSGSAYRISTDGNEKWGGGVDSGADGAEDRRSTAAAEAWMYGGVDGSRGGME